MNEMLDGQLGVVLSMAYAMLLGGAIGFERELKRRPAGFRTHMLVAGAAALLIGIGQLSVAERLAGDSSQMMRIDPLRLVEAVIAGVSFIGAGTIFSEGRRGGETIAGITTAASLLTVATIGVAAGLNYHLLALLATVLALLVLVGLSAWERWRERRAGAPPETGHGSPGSGSRSGSSHPDRGHHQQSLHSPQRAAPGKAAPYEPAGQADPPARDPQRDQDE
ncbi:MgtC/SapB family protein [Luteimonas sp. SJ-92]|uniref:Protein MgtC n=1 Tax=Luteimonas salinisoli TaxID=2752307 RepID=A0A853J9D6_9GAMM|nr:MgtC/SapB family protein [Luteimonas salinisoli]NZA25260.1 MgtC/SapB family protein [Luteimonas salinisoli]